MLPESNLDKGIVHISMFAQEILLLSCAKLVQSGYEHTPFWQATQNASYSMCLFIPRSPTCRLLGSASLSFLAGLCLMSLVLVLLVLGTLVQRPLSSRCLEFRVCRLKFGVVGCKGSGI